METVKELRLNYKTKTLLESQEVNKKDVEFAIRQAKLSVEADLLETEKSLATEEAKLEVLKTTFPLDAQGIVNKKSEIEGLKKGISAMKSLKKELFGE